MTHWQILSAKFGQTPDQQEELKKIISELPAEMFTIGTLHKLLSIYTEELTEETYDIIVRAVNNYEYIKSLKKSVDIRISNR